jgi:hypothetical protein
LKFLQSIISLEISYLVLKILCHVPCAVFFITSSLRFKKGSSRTFANIGQNFKDIFMEGERILQRIELLSVDLCYKLYVRRLQMLENEELSVWSQTSIVNWLVILSFNLIVRACNINPLITVLFFAISFHLPWIYLWSFCSQ